MEYLLSKGEILALAKACRKWPAGKGNWWYLGPEPLEVSERVRIEATFRQRGAKDG